MNWKYLRCTEDVFLEIPLSLVSRRLNFKSLEIFSQRGGMGGSALCLTPGLAGWDARGDCLFPWEAHYPDIYHILINTDFPLLVFLLCPALYFFLSCKWRHTREYKHHYAPLWINMHCSVHSLPKTAAYCTEGVRRGLRNTPVWLPAGVIETFIPWMREFKEIHVQGPSTDTHPERRPEALLRGPRKGYLHHGPAVEWVVALALGSGNELCNHTGEGWFQGQTHMSTAPEMMLIQNATTGLPWEV